MNDLRIALACLMFAACGGVSPRDVDAGAQLGGDASTAEDAATGPQERCVGVRGICTRIASGGTYCGECAYSCLSDDAGTRCLFPAR